MITGTALLRDEKGTSLVSSMLVLSVLAVFALVAASVAVNERRTSFNEGAHMRAFMAADAGGEAAIGFLRSSERPPVFTDFGDLRVGNVLGEELFDGIAAVEKTEFDYDITMPGAGANHQPKRPRPGFSSDGQFWDYYYYVDSKGEAGVDGASRVDLVVSKLFQDGYN